MMFVIAGKADNVFREIRKLARLAAVLKKGILVQYRVCLTDFNLN
jgi:hypothetical protein